MKLSIITINRNNAAGLRKTMDSVFSQTYRDFEYIVVDGASTDGSVDVIKEYDSINHSSIYPLTFTWISEPDTGIYNAMNKGLKMSHGEYTLMLNSADYLVDEQVIDHIIPELHAEDIIQGNELYYKNGILYRDKGYARSELLFNDVFDGYFHHQTSFIKRELLEKIGFYDDSYKKGADTYFFIKALGLGNSSFRYADIDIAYFDMFGIASGNDPMWAEIGRNEDKRFYKENIPYRLTQFYRKSATYYQMCMSLERSKVLWKIAKFLVMISNKMYGPIHKTIVEKVKKNETNSL